MAKKSGYLDRIEQARREAFFTTQHFTKQLILDQAAIVLNREFGFGADRLKRFTEAMSDIYSDYADIWNGDTKDVEYSKAAMDRALQQIFGSYFEPWEIRYGRKKNRHPEPDR